MLDKKILLVDDEPLNLRVLTAYLISAGYIVEQANNGQHAWEILLERSDEFVAMVSDWMMPEMTGVELLKQVKQHERTARIPVIMLTGVNEQDDIIEAVQAGAFDYLLKPVDKVLLLAMLQRVLEE